MFYMVHCPGAGNGERKWRKKMTRNQIDSFFSRMKIKRNKDTFSPKTVYFLKGRKYFHSNSPTNAFLSCSEDFSTFFLMDYFFFFLICLNLPDLVRVVSLCLITIRCPINRLNAFYINR